MKKVLSALGVLFGLWVALSAIQLVFFYHGAIPKWNFFNPPAAAAVETIKPDFSDGGTCGSPITAETRIDCAIVSSISGNEIIFETVSDGNLWTVEVGNADNFNPNGYYCIYFDTNGTDSNEDDTIAKAFIEVW